MTHTTTPAGLRIVAPSAPPAPMPDAEPLRYYRTTADAFRGMEYGAALVRPWPPLWKRILRAIWGWL